MLWSLTLSEGKKKEKKFVLMFKEKSYSKKKYRKKMT